MLRKFWTGYEKMIDISGFTKKDIKDLADNFDTLNEGEQRKVSDVIKAFDFFVTAKEDYSYFIESYIYIEDVDSAEKIQKFKLWEQQRKTLEAFEENRLNIVLKARQLGLTWLALAYALYKMIYEEGFKVVGLSKTENDAKELICRIVLMLENMPKWIIQSEKEAKKNPLFDGFVYCDTVTTVTIIHPKSKKESTFVSMPASKGSGRSFTVNLVMLDEWAFQQWAREIWASAYPTVNRPTGGKVIGLSTAKRLTLFEDVWWMSWRDKLSPFNPIFLDWRTDPRRTNEWYEETKKALPLSYKAEYPNTPEEAFEAAEGVAFGEFSRLIHVVEPFEIPTHWRKWMSVDNGYTDPFAWYWFAVSEDGIVYVYREYTRDPKKDEKLTYSIQAENAVRKSGNERIAYTVAGHDAWAVNHLTMTPENPSGKSIISYYSDGGIKNCIKAQIDRKLRKATIHEYLKPYMDENVGKMTAKLQIFDTCTKLIETLPQLINDEKDVEKVAECTIDHWYDSLGYGLISHHAQRSYLEDKPNLKKLSPDALEDYNMADKEHKKYLAKKWGLYE